MKERKTWNNGVGKGGRGVGPGRGREERRE